MIVSHIIGGLGNQMFQYAAGRALAERLRQPLRLDVSDFANYRLHNGFELARVFAVPVALATPNDVRSVLGWQAIRPLKRLLLQRSLSVLRRNQYVVEPHFHYWKGIEQIRSNGYLTGDWQSEKYFKSVEAVIRADFVFKPPLSAINQKIADQIESYNAVSLHVRRGDYVHNTKTLAYHGVCSLDYYRAAVRHLAERVNQPSFFIFSDDPAWAKDNLKVDFPCHYVDHNHGTESYNDMRLMSMCRHHIIANSSFSWWGAWLNPAPGKIVIAPRNWFANNNDVSDLFPHGWVTM